MNLSYLKGAKSSTVSFCNSDAQNVKLCYNGTMTKTEEITMPVYFEEIKKNFGFGWMRLPEKDGEIDIPACCELADTFLAAGFNYFDTAHGYTNGKSESILKAAVTSRHPRESFVLTDKLSTQYFKKNNLFKKGIAFC